MQKIIDVCVSVHEYVAHPQFLLTEDVRVWPFCPDGHRLWSHGSYLRFAIVEQGAEHRIPVLRLFCPRLEQTLSLLPDRGRLHSEGTG